MASLFLSSSVIPLSSSYKLFFPHHYHYRQLNWNSLQKHPLQKCFTFTIYASSPNKSSRAGRKVKSNEELCNDIREFLSVVGLPNDHVPTLKELSEHGRNDLANIVRRRGYKFVRELLASSTNTDCSGFIAEKGLSGQDEKVDNEIEDDSLLVEEPRVRNYFGSTNIDSNLNSDDYSWLPIESSANSSLKEKESYSFDVQNEYVDNIVEDVSLSSDMLAVNNHSGRSCSNRDLNSNEMGLLPVEFSSSSCLEEKASISSNIEGQHEKKNIAENIFSLEDVSIMENYPSSPDIEPSPNFVEHHYTSQEASATLTLEEKIAKFIQNGDLDMIEDNVYGVLNESDTKENKEVIVAEDTVETKSGITGAEHLEPGYNHRADGAITLNGSTLTSMQIASSVTVNDPLRHDGLETEGIISADFDRELDIETGGRENQLEINNLKSMLHQKELELSRLKEQIEKEKHNLSALQTKVETEITKAQKLISEKDAELHAVEESLSGLEEVQIQYSGEGEIVEVTGSFNGWHHRIKMDPLPSSGIIEPVGSRKSKLWSTVLWLYPGIYEIKFIVDGQWRTDPQRETVSRGGILNNILQVDR